MTDREAKELLGCKVTRKQLKAVKPLLELKKIQQPELLLGINIERKENTETFNLYYMAATKVIRVIER